jgi:hypothetical protein
LTQYLDQLLPFLEAAPRWFKIWVYVLVALIAATIAFGFVFYLQMKDRQFTARGSENFQISVPNEGDEIPISETKNWLMRGRFPILGATDGNDSAETRLTVDRVERLPGLEPVPQEDSSVVGPTADGSWQAKITTPTEGRYRIVVKGHIGKQSPLVREVTVVCIGKAQVFAKRMKEDRSIRGVGQMPHRPPAMIDEALYISQLSDIETRFFSFFDSRDWDQSLALVTQALDIIDPALLHSPNDLYFQNQRAYFFKNYAIVMREKKREDEVKRALEESETMFKAILDQDQTDPGAWNGMGSVLIMQGKPQDALFYIREALNLKPDYWQAKNDQQLALNLIESEKAGNAP